MFFVGLCHFETFQSFLEIGVRCFYRLLSKTAQANLMLVKELRQMYTSYVDFPSTGQGVINNLRRKLLDHCIMGFEVRNQCIVIWLQVRSKTASYDKLELDSRIRQMIYL
jgi:hypothetical protein